MSTHVSVLVTVVQPGPKREDCSSRKVGPFGSEREKLIQGYSRFDRGCMRQCGGLG